MIPKKSFYLLLSFIIFSISCKQIQEDQKTKIAVPTSNEVKRNPEVSKPKIETIKPESEPAPNHLKYQFLNTESQQNLTDLIPLPDGFQRVSTAKSSFAEWLRYLPAKPLGTEVKLHSGSLKPNQNAHFAIINMDVGTRDLQQCADAVMRLKAEYHYSKKDFSKIHFNFTSGDRVAFEDWMKGRKPKISGNKVTFTSAGPNIDDSYPNFKKYMIMIFNYAGTMSLSKELKSVAVEDMQIGDVFIQGGFPGHAVIVIDMAENDKGEKKFLLAQSYMPAQDMHILKNYENNDLNPWYSLNFGDQLSTPEWSFSKDDLKRF